ncbi:MAG: RNA polymerase sigma factor [Ignavibacteriales bacterium]|nr:RNA polymerase sigma factor [Ignavibacteriales bacterium]
MKTHVQMDDHQILTLYHAGRRNDALKKFSEIYQSRLYSLTYRMLGNHDDARDAMQEILINVDKSLPTFKGHSSLYTWVYRLGSNICLNYRKRRARPENKIDFEIDLLDSILPPKENQQKDPDEMCASDFRKYLVEKSILELPESQRIVLVMSDVEGLTGPEIAKALRIELTAVKARLHRARASLKKIIEKHARAKGIELIGPDAPGCTREYLSESLN